MKKRLFLTTVLGTASLFALGVGGAVAQAVAPAAPEKMKIQIGGFVEQLVSYSDQEGKFEDSAGIGERSKFDIKSDTEVHFKGSVKLDNGMTIRAVIELQADVKDNASEGDRIDESYMWIDHPTFGSLQLGADDAITQTLTVGAPWVGFVNPHDGDFTKFLIAPSSFAAPRTSTSGSANAQDDTRITYLSPVVAGFRLGFGYAPDTANSDTQPLESSASVFDVGLLYSQKFGDFDVRGSLGFMREDATSAATSATGQGNTYDYTIGADIRYANFTLGGGFGSDERQQGNTGIANTAIVPDDKRFNVGLKYDAGPYSVGVYYGHAWAPGTVANPKDDEQDRYLLGANYIIGPGVTLTGSVIAVDWESETGLASRENTAWAAIGGIHVDF